MVWIGVGTGKQSLLACVSPAERAAVPPIQGTYRRGWAARRSAGRAAGRSAGRTAGRSAGQTAGRSAGRRNIIDLDHKHVVDIAAGGGERDGGAVGQHDGHGVMESSRKVRRARRVRGNATAYVAASPSEAPRPQRPALRVQLDHKHVINAGGDERDGGAVGQHDGHGALEVSRNVQRARRRVHGNGTAYVTASPSKALRPQRPARRVQLDHTHVMNAGGDERDGGAVGQRDVHGVLEVPRNVRRARRWVHGNAIAYVAASPSKPPRPQRILGKDWLNAIAQKDRWGNGKWAFSLRVFDESLQ